MNGFSVDVGVYPKFRGYVVRLRVVTPDAEPQTTEAWYGTKLGARWKARRVRKSFQRRGWTVWP